MTAPTEAEVRAFVEPEFSPNGGLNAAGRLSDAFGAIAGLVDDLFDITDFRASEQEALDAAAYEEIGRIRDRAISDCKEAVVAAVLRFAAEHPDAPRSTSQPTRG